MTAMEHKINYFWQTYVIVHVYITSAHQLASYYQPQHNIPLYIFAAFPY